MEKAVARAGEKVVWYSREDMILSFHSVSGYTKRLFRTYRDMFRFVLGLIEIGFRIM